MPINMGERTDEMLRRDILMIDEVPMRAQQRTGLLVAGSNPLRACLA